MSKDPYQAGMFKTDPYYKKTEIKGRLVVVLDGRYEERGLELIQQPSRAVLKNEIHELIITDEQTSPGQKVQKIAYIGFMEVLEGGVMVAGDEVIVEGQTIGRVAGFDVTHMPNHLNIVIHAETRRSGRELAFDLNHSIIIKK